MGGEPGGGSSEGQTGFPELIYHVHKHIITHTHARSETHTQSQWNSCIYMWDLLICDGVGSRFHEEWVVYSKGPCIVDQIFEQIEIRVSVCVCVCVCLCMCVCVCVCVCVSIYEHISLCVCVCVYIWAHICVCVCVCVYCERPAFQETRRGCFFIKTGSFINS